MRNRRKKLIMIMSVILVVLIIIGIVIGVLKVKHKKDLEEQGIYYQDGAEAVEEWDDEDIAGEDNEDIPDDGEGLEVIDGDDDISNSSNSKNENGNKDTASNNSTSSDKKENNNNNTANSGSSNNNTSNNKKDPVKVPAAGKLSYAEYIAMSPEKQEEYFEKFDSEQEFFDWYREAKAEYDKNNQGNVVEGGNIDIGDYMD